MVEYYTPNEIKHLTEFASTPEGQKIIQKSLDKLEIGNQRSELLEILKQAEDLQTSSEVVEENMPSEVSETPQISPEVIEEDIQLDDNFFTIPRTKEWKRDIALKRFLTKGFRAFKNPEGDIIEFITKSLKGDQDFTFEAAIRETEKAGKKLPANFETIQKIVGTKPGDEDFQDYYTSFLKRHTILPVDMHNVKFNRKNNKGTAIWLADGNYVCFLDYTYYRGKFDTLGGVKTFFQVRCLKDK